MNAIRLHSESLNGVPKINDETHTFIGADSADIWDAFEAAEATAEVAEERVLVTA